MNIIPMNYNQAYENALLALKAGLVPYVTGQPGAGKSAMAQQLANNFNLELIDLRLSMLEPSDINGLPNFTANGTAYFAPFDTFPLETTPLPEGKAGWLIFADEASAASRSTLAAAYGLILEKRVGNRKLHPNVAIMAAGNRESDGAITTKIGTAMQSRLVHIELSVSHADWLENVAVPKSYSSEIIAFLGQFPDKLNNFNPKHEEQTFACPRSWEFTDKILKAHNKPITQTLLPLLAGTIGMSTALSFVQFATSLSDMPAWEDVLNHTARVPSNLNSRWATVTMLFENWEAVHADKIISYADNFSLDLRIFLFRMILKKHPSDAQLPSMRKMMVELSRYLS